MYTRLFILYVRRESGRNLYKKSFSFRLFICCRAEISYYESDSILNEIFLVKQQCLEEKRIKLYFIRRFAAAIAVAGKQICRE